MPSPLASIDRLAALRSRFYDEEILAPPASDGDLFWSRPGQSHDRRPELYGELTEPQADAFEYHYERRGLDTWRQEYEKIRRGEPSAS